MLSVAPLICLLSLFSLTLAQNVTYEAESGTLTGGAVVESTATGYSGTGYVSGFLDNNQTLTINLNIATADTYNVYITYQAPNGEKYTSLSINGASSTEVYLPAITTFTTIAGGHYPLTAGANTVKFTGDWGWYYLDKIQISTYVPPAAPPLTPISATGNTTYEAEYGTLSGTTVDTAIAGFTGTGYVTSFDASADSLTVPVLSNSTTLYDFFVTYNAPYGDKYTAFSLNGVPNGEIHFAPTTGFVTVSAGQVLLTTGVNNITFTTDWGWYLIDSISFAVAAPPAPHQVTGALNNPNATAITKKLMAYLVSQYGKHILSGQQDPPSYA